MTVKRVTGDIGDVLDKRQVSRLLRCGEKTVSRLVKDGPLAPALLDQKGPRKSMRFSKAAIEMYVAVRDSERVLDPQDERARKDKASADLAEFRLHVERDQYLPADEVEQAKAAENSALKALLMTWSSALVDAVHRASRTEGVAGVETVIEAAVREVLTELADPERPILCPGCGVDMSAPEDVGTCRAQMSSGRRCKNSADDGGYCYIESHKEVT